MNFLVLEFEHRAGNLKEGKYGFLYSDIDLSKRYTGYNNFYTLEPIRKWIITGEWNQEEIGMAINQKNETLKLNEPKDLLLRSSLLYVEDDTFNVGFPEVLNEAYNGALNFNQYIVLMIYIFEAKKYSIALPQEPNYKKLLEGLNTRLEHIKESKISEPEFNYGLDEETIKSFPPEGQVLIKRIHDYREYQQHFKNRSILINELKNNDFNKVLESLKNYLQYFDTRLSDLVFEYYNKLDNRKRLSFGKSLVKSIKIHNRLSKSDISMTISGLESLIHNMHNSSSKQIRKAIDKIVLEDFENLLDDIKKTLEAFTGDEFPYPQIIIGK